MKVGRTEDRAAMKRANKEGLKAEEKLLAAGEPPIDTTDRPRDDRDCETMAKPCPFVGCAYHLYLDVNPRTGAILFNFPGLEPSELEYSCSLEEARRGGLTLEEVATRVSLTRERIRQMEVRILNKLGPLIDPKLLTRKRRNGTRTSEESAAEDFG